jgi:hypothetical protein
VPGVVAVVRTLATAPLILREMVVASVATLNRTKSEGDILVVRKAGRVV